MIKTTFGGIITLLEELKVKQIIIGKQFDISANYNKFLKIVKEKNIKVNIVEAGVKINIEKNLFFQILWPNDEQEVTENSINNNALVCKLNYKNFSMLFTGDIEKEAEKVLVENYAGKNDLKATVLKVGHHGSKTSSTYDFLNLVKPKIALIGVGKNNSFGHPNGEVLEQLHNFDTQIYRTDENGEIDITVNNRGNIKIKKRIV